MKKFQEDKKMKVKEVVNNEVVSVSRNSGQVSGLSDKQDYLNYFRILYFAFSKITNQQMRICNFKNKNDILKKVKRKEEKKKESKKNVIIIFYEQLLINEKL